MTKDAPSCLLVCRSPEEYLQLALRQQFLVESLQREFLAVLVAQDEEIDGVKQKYRLHDQTDPSRLAWGSTSTDDLLASAVLATRQHPADAPVCVVQAGEEAVLLGAAHAVRSRKRLLILDSQWCCSELRAVAHSASSITFVLSGATCADVGWDRLVDVLRSHGLSEPNRSAWGVLTASKLTHLSEIISRLSFYEPRPYEAPRHFSVGSGGHNGPGVFAVELPPHPSNDLIDSLSGPGASLSHFIGHGRWYCALSGNLCGLASPTDAGSSECLDGLECIFKDHKRAPANELRSDVVVVESCNVASFQHTGPNERHLVNLAVRMLEGYSVGVVSPYRTQVNWPATPRLVSALGHAGYSTGEICGFLNECLVSRAGGLGSFVLVGDPEALLYASPHVDVGFALSVQTAPGSWDISVQASGAPLELYKLVSGNIPSSVGGPSLHVYKDAGGDFSVEFLRGLEGGLMMLCTWEEPPKLGDYTFSVTLTPPIAEDMVKRAMTTHARIEAESALQGATSRPPEPNLLTEVERSFACSLYSDTASSTSYEAMNALALRIEEDSFAAQRSLISKLLRHAWHKGFWAFRHYNNTRGIRFLSVEDAADRCHCCGGRIVLRTYRVGIWPEAIRVLLECERCMLVADYPLEGMPLFLRYPPEIRTERHFEMTMEARNPQPSRLIVIGGLAIDALDAPLSEFSVTPPVHESTIEPNGLVKFAFRATFSRKVPTQVFNAQGLVLANGALSWCMGRLKVIR